MAYLEQGSAAFWRANLALFIAGWVTFACLYSTQPILPTLTAEFGVAPALASLSLSVTTAALAVSLLVVAAVSDAVGRKPIMAASLVASGTLALLTAAAPDFPTLLALRALQGVALAGFSAVALAYLGEEVAPHFLGLAVGIYVSGNVLGGMSGRLTVGLLTESHGWRGALGALGAAGLIGGLLFWWLLPASAHFTPRPLAPGRFLGPLLVPLREPGLRRLYAIGFLVVGGFVTMYNYLGYALVAPPYNLSPAAVGWVFLSYLAGVFSSTIMGRWADRVGRRPVMASGALIMLAGATLSLSEPLALKIVGLVVFTFGSVAVHSITSGWVGQRAPHYKAQATALYLFSYYLGSSLAGYAGGYFWSGWGWPGVIAMVTACVLGALGLLARLDPTPRPLAPPVAAATSEQPR